MSVELKHHPEEWFFLHNFDIDKVFSTIQRADYLILYYIKMQAEQHPDSKVYLADLAAVMGLKVTELSKAVEKLQIIDITLTPPDDDPQLVFESLNSTGLELNEGDKIRNFVLMGLDIEEQERYYDSYWNPIEKNAGYDKQNNSYDVSPFIRDYLSIKNITLSYRLPATWSKRLTLGGIRLHAAIENVALFSKRKGLNPVQTFDGIVNNYTSIARVFSFGVNINL